MEIKIKKYSNGSYSYWSKTLKREHNIPSELAKGILELQWEVRKLKPYVKSHLLLIENRHD